MVDITFVKIIFKHFGLVLLGIGFVDSILCILNSGFSHLHNLTKLQLMGYDVQ